jgi:hypothetical protein
MTTITTELNSPAEPSKSYARHMGRGGVGNYVEAKKWDGIPGPPGPEMPIAIEPLVHYPLCIIPNRSRMHPKYHTRQAEADKGISRLVPMKLRWSGSIAYR